VEKRRGDEPVSKQNPFDPFAMWKNLYDKTESQWSKAFDESMRKEDFSEWMGQFLNMYLQYQDMVKQSTEKYLSQANVPSRADLSNLASLIVNLEAKVDNLEEMIEEDLSHQISSLNEGQEINRLKSDINDINKKLDQVLEFIQKQTEPKQGSAKEVTATKTNEQSKAVQKNKE
jgi:polyhydroxyalkanoic acid synthase PhaR subunit